MVGAVIYGLIAVLAIWLRGRMIRKTVKQYSEKIERYLRNQVEKRDT